ncbi:trifunctional serine/threonine-protein kinase/ATP-binding protein/sensor histidine kinase [Pyxidicoccus xibeiensis]|uniref:trifunctional serine/threonine-protein kinase/ATP-binding protein/sensor histidine kinase n=1 Tax=Pyxidicoccus xibeiensis TaxID=2906759 RepID=UPI0020A70788|nr:trifunctional serine/threonine-protein kinase/ATP-binding protein/sensor histidine kinase [Pyxidicoccus xibeiensis]MCP3140977.1 AAA family ATPase [Pyxidicoccus xibeiensis]
MVTNIGDYDITGWIHESRNSLIMRGRRRSDGLPVILKMTRERNPTPLKLTRLKHEYALLGTLEGEGFVRAHELVEDGGRWALVQEDFGGASLSHLGMAGTLTLEEFLTLALQLTGILGTLHQRRVVHKDLNPSNIVMNRGTGRVALIDFGVSTLLSQETRAFSGLNALVGTLVYMSPEQTGRMNRPIDYRTDYYSLGATFYELLTGQPPLLSKDPLELVHWIIARQPVSPHELDARIPRAVADIVLKLLSKSADERYQSARGLQADLSECLEQLRRTGVIAPFPLGRQDGSEHFRLPQKLYGRQPQVERLLAAFERTRQGPALLTVSGDPGIGKSALVQEVYRPLTLRRGYFAAGKFEHDSAQVPYAALGQVFQSLVQQLLTESEERLSARREQLTAALGPHAGLLAPLCPALERVLGKLSAPADLPPSEARDRFHQLVRDFLAAFSAPEHPLCLFLDDLQWADADSLKLLGQLLAPGSSPSLFVVGAYRDNEVGPGHPLTLTLRELETQGAAVEHLVLAPLGREDVTALVADTLAVSPEAAAPLAELLGARTGGNPFFVRAFLTELHAEGLLAYTSQGWRWDVEHIQRKGITDNVVDLMNLRVERLPAATRSLLDVAACLGGRFDLDTLEVVAGLGHGRAGEALWPAVVEGLVIALAPVQSAADLVTQGAPLELRFTHDRVRQAVLSRLAPEVRSRMHRDIGRRLLEAGHPGEHEQGLFDVVGQLNQGRSAMSDAAELDALAGLNLRAARRALQGAAAQRALEHARVSISLLGAQDWEQRHAFCWDVYMAALEAAFLCSDLETFAALAKVLLAHARTLLDEIKVRRLEGQLLFFQQRTDDALRLYLDVLRRLGHALPHAPGPEDIGRELQATAQLLGNRPIEELAGLPECTQPEARAILEFLGHAMRASSMGMLFPVAICRIVQRSLQQGNSPDSVTGYLFYGALLVQGGDHDRACRFGRLALKLAERYDIKSLLAQVNHYGPALLFCWQQPLYELVPTLVDSYRHARESGSPYDIANNATGLCQMRFFSGKDLRELAADMEGYHDVVRKQRNPLVLGWYEPLHQLVLDLVQDTAEPRLLAGPVYDAKQRLDGLGSTGLAAPFIHHHCHALLSYLFGDVAGALASAEAAEPGFMLMGGSLWAGPIVLLRSLYRLAACTTASPAERERLLEKVAADQQLLAAWLPHNPRSMEHRQLLVEAERARVLGDVLRARESFERAVELARRSGYQHEEALAYELAGRFCLSQDDAKRARHHLRYAHQAYLRWGAVAKARALEREHPHLLPRFALASLTTQTLAVTGDDQDFHLLDVLSVLNASQAISSELALDKLLVHLMQLLIETAGAETGYLMLERGGRWVAAVEKTVGRDDIQLLGSVPVEELEAQGRRGVPTSIVHYVARTQESIVLDDASVSERFGRDAYIVRNQVRSVLCFPLSRQGGRVSMVYLENNLSRAAFTRDRLRILQLLSSQAVISLENALLYETLEQKVEQRTQELQVKNEQLASTLSRLQETQNRLILQDRLASLGAMTAGIAHELRNPLNFVNSFSRLSADLLQEMLDELASLGTQLDSQRMASLRDTVTDLGGNLSKIGEHGKRMEGIIRSMLEHSRGGRGNTQEADLNAVVSTYVNLAWQGVRSRKPDAQVEFELALDDSAGKVSLMPQEFSRVIVNIVDNACHAVSMRKAQAGPADFKPRIQVRSRNLGNRVEVGIRDNGVGIPHLIRDKIFNPFFTTKQPGEGTGLGLSISHDIIVKGHGGTLHFESEEGAFTEFIITLPRGEPQGGVN